MYSRSHSCLCKNCYFENNGHAGIMSLLSLHVLYVAIAFVICFWLYCLCCIIFALVTCTCTASISAFSFCFQISPRYPQKCVFFANKLPIYPSDTVHSLLCFAILLTTLLILLLYALCHLFLLLITFRYLFILQICYLFAEFVFG